MHKARENANGSFSIGKTWMLDDLSGVKSFGGSTPTTPEEEQHKLWAGGNGFIVNIGKPYYWQANTPKEKQFFIASLVKIFTKYTGGKNPELIGFDQRERDQLLGVSAAAAARPIPPSLQPAAGPPPPRLTYGQTQNRPPPLPQDRVLRPQPSRDGMQRTSPGPAPPMPPSAASSFTSQTSRPALRNRREESPSGSMESGATTPLQNPPVLRRLAGSNQSQESFGRGDDNTSANVTPRSRGGTNGVSPAPGRFGDRSITPNSLRVGTPDSSYSNAKDPVTDVPPVPTPLALPPERRRPPIANLGDSSRQRGQNTNDDMIPAPLASPGMRREDLRPPVRSTERTQPRDSDVAMSNLPGNTNGSGRSDRPRKSSESTPRKSSESAARSESLKSSNSVPVAASVPSPVPPPTVEIPEVPKVPEIPDTLSPTSPEEEARPGLGPMIKKKSKGDVAGSFLKAAKAASAFNSFKPRAGGAAERLREMQAKQTDGPDGITGVVPAPSLVRGMSSDSTNSPTPATAAATVSPGKSPRKNKDSIPEVKITVPPTGRPSSVEAPAEVATVEKPKAREPRRPKPVSETMHKELASLGVDSSILGGRGSDLVELWEQFGWVGEGIRTKNMDQMQDEIDRELNKIQAGGWLSRLDEEDERIEGIKSGLDKCIEECDELDGLLTLYSVELSVSFLFNFVDQIANFLDTERRYCLHRGAITGSAGPNCQPAFVASRTQNPSRYDFHLFRTAG